jgi:hypothetical protein
MRRAKTYEEALELIKEEMPFVAKGGITVFFRHNYDSTYTLIAAIKKTGVLGFDCPFERLETILRLIFSEAAFALHYDNGWRPLTQNELHFVENEMMDSNEEDEADTPALINTTGHTSESDNNFAPSPNECKDLSGGEIENPADRGVSIIDFTTNNLNVDHADSRSGCCGWIYILANSSMSGILKIGRTDRTPSERADELSAATGVPTPFLIVWEEETGDSAAAEAEIHRLLADHRINLGREFFKIDTKSAIQIVTRACSSYPIGIKVSDDKVPHDTEREDELIMRALQIIQKEGSIDPRIIRMRLRASFEESRAIFDKLKLMGTIDDAGRKLTGYWAEEIRKSLKF